MKILPLLLMLFLWGMNSHAQMGCTDPLALNYDADAAENDGSCEYGLTEYSPQEITILPNTLKESSGLAWIDGKLWAHNDSGNENKIYQIDTINGAVQQTVTIATADNIDWEDLAADESYLYIGDFGNNPGDRMDLSVLRIAKSDLSNAVVNAEVIAFEYSDQTDFTANDNNHNFDCEAMFVFNDSIHLFSKNWEDNQTKHYVLPATPGTHTAQLVETFDVGMLITGADIMPTGEVVLIAYNSFGFGFIWLLFDYSDTHFFSGNKRRLSLGFGLANGQTEGIVFRENAYGYICSEQFDIGQLTSPPKLLSFSVKEWLGEITKVSELDDSYAFLSYPNPVEDFVNIVLSRRVDSWYLSDLYGTNIKTGKLIDGTLSFNINMESLSPGMYFIEIEKDGQSLIQRLIKQ